MTDRGNIWEQDDKPTADAGAGGSVAAVVAAGLPLEAGLRALSEEAPTHSLRRTLRKMSDELAAGESADEVLARDGSGVPRYVRGLVKAGVQSGQLGSFLEEFLLAVRRRRAALHRFWMALFYPLLLLPVTLLSTSFVLAWIVPQFKDIFNDFGVELPGLTLLLIWLSDLVTIPVIIGLLLLVPAALLLMQLMPLLFGRARWTRMMQHLPLFGTSSRMRGNSEFCSLLGLLVSGDIPLHEALEVTGGALQDANLRAGCRKLAEQVAGGATMLEGAQRMARDSSPRGAAASTAFNSQSSLLQLANFPPELVALFHWEARGKAFGDILRQAAIVFDVRTRVQFLLVRVFLEPLLLLFVGSILALTVVGLFLPLIRLLNELS